MKSFKIYNVTISSVEEMLLHGDKYANSDIPFRYKNKSGRGLDLYYSSYNRTVYGYNPDYPGDDVSVFPRLKSNQHGIHDIDAILSGIGVTFDIIYPVYWSPQLQRYHFLYKIDLGHMDTLSMICKFQPVEQLFNDKVDPEIIANIQSMVNAYMKCKEMKESIPESDPRVFHIILTDGNEMWHVNDLNGKFPWVAPKVDDSVAVHGHTVLTIKEMERHILDSLPQGLMKAARIKTNALQLKTIIKQREHHKLDEWIEFVDWAKGLYFWRYFGLFTDYLDKEESAEVSKVSLLLDHIAKGRFFFVYDDTAEYGIRTHYTDSNGIINDITPQYTNSEVFSLPDAIANMIDQRPWSDRGLHVIDQERFRINHIYNHRLFRLHWSRLLAQ